MDNIWASGSNETKPAPCVSRGKTCPSYLIPNAAHTHAQLLDARKQRFLLRVLEKLERAQHSGADVGRCE
jgi:hypothetical protein